MRRTRLISREKSKAIDRRTTVLSFYLAALSCVVPGPLAAETEVRGLPDAMYLRAESASVGEVLAALSAEFRLRYPTQASLDRTVTGVYSGTLRHVLMRILDGTNYVIKYSEDDIEIKVLSSASAVDGPTSISPVAVNQNLTAPPRATSGSSPPPIAPLVPK